MQTQAVRSQAPFKGERINFSLLLDPAESLNCKAQFPDFSAEIREQFSFFSSLPMSFFKTSLIDIGSSPDKLLHHYSQGAYQEYSCCGTKEFHGLRLLFYK